ncbi:hypothetical protein [Veillonella sp.]|uniref:hypothetical protein n=1 Tax=Veillonella sp. TaxID=1926307 RepID=UPI002900E405|nr:hypothetical protein [Veillonella sp.]MDU2301193.1 hypothetical protein [Veillonella sp.]MDU2388169.1 hypothetical protein [Veillonella sp.]
MMKRALMAALCFSFVTLGSQAIDINIPGADPTISKDAYQNYRKSDATAKQMESDVNTMIRKQYADNKPKNWSIDELVYFAEELNHSAGFSSSVFILKNDGANIKFTIPSGSRFGVTIKGDPMTTEVKRGNFIFNEGNLKYSIHKEKEGNSKANTFSYPTIKNGSWEVRQNQKGTLEGVLSFRMKADPSLSYQVAYDLSKSRELELLKNHNQEYVYKQLMSPLVNYVLPSIEPAKQLLSKTKPITINGFTFQTLKSSDLTYNGPDNDAIYIYDGKSYREGIMVRELQPKELAKPHTINAKLIQYFAMYKPYSEYRPIQYATVWNDATPAIYMEVERSTSRMYIQSLYDDKYLYTHFIMADLDYKVPSKDLRDVVQYVDNANDKDKYSKSLAGMSAVPKGVFDMTLFPKKQ